MLKLTSKILPVVITLSFLLSNSAFSHLNSAQDRASQESTSYSFSIEPEYFRGKNGYQHTGLGMEILSPKTTYLAMNYHTSQEESDAPTYHSLGLTLGNSNINGNDISIFGFTYFKKEGKHANGIGIQFERTILQLGKDASASIMFRPAFVNISAINENTDNTENINHTMLMSGLTMQYKLIDLSIFGTHSFFSKNPQSLETNVDMGELTGIEVYENNDGFPKNSIASIINFPLSERLTVSGQYAILWFEGQTPRHSIFPKMALSINSYFNIFFGMQWLRGGIKNDMLGFGGLSLTLDS